MPRPRTIERTSSSSPPKFIKLSPFEVRYKILNSVQVDSQIRPDGTIPGDWDLERVKLETTAKHLAMIEHFRDGKPWIETTLFKKQYKLRFGLGGRVRDCRSLSELAAHYTYYDRMFESLKEHGFVPILNGEPTVIPSVYLCRDGELALGNNGNHRMGMAKLLELDQVILELKARHPDAPPKEFYTMTGPIPPVLHKSQLDIPAMTTIEERRCYYRYAKEAANRGNLVEVGTWLGASTVFLAAGIRDRANKAFASELFAYDRFTWQPMHEHKAGGPLTEGKTMLDAFKENVGDLLSYVHVEQTELKDVKWDHGLISYAAFDGPKRTREILQALQIFGPHFDVGAYISWQDFAYFPAYDLVAVMSMLEARHQLIFMEAVYPGTTVVFRTMGKIHPEMADPGVHARINWDPPAIRATWDRWRGRFPQPAQPRFMVGAAMFMADRGYPKEAGSTFKQCLAEDANGAVRSKMEYLRLARPTFVSRYQSLFEQL